MSSFTQGRGTLSAFVIDESGSAVLPAVNGSKLFQPITA
jgi:hypothetical protein